MLSTKLEDIQEQIGSALKEADELKEAAKDRDFSAEEQEKAEKITSEVSRLVEERKAAQRGEGLKTAIDGLAAAVGEVKATQPDGVVRLEDVLKLTKPQGETRKSWGEQVTDAPEFQAALERFKRADGGYAIPEKTHVEVPPISMKSIFTEGSATQGGPLLAPDERGLLGGFGPFVRPPVLRDLITVGRTSSDSIRYARITGYTNAAAGVHEASTATGTDPAGGLKPQSDVQTEIKTATVVTIAHWFAMSKQSLADIPLLRTYIDNLGRSGLVEEEEDQIVAGAGSASDELEGFNTVSTIQTQIFATDMFQSIRKAITKIGKVGRARATGVLVNFEDDEFMDLYRFDQGGGAGTGAWVGNGPFQSGPKTTWGLPRVVSEACPTGKAYVADFRTIVLAVREDPTVAMTDSHSDYFVRNLIALLFEERATQLVMQPKAIVEVATA